MSRRKRLAVSVLFIVIIVLAVAITRFYSNTGKSMKNGDVRPIVSQKLSSDSHGNHIFQDSSGLFGILDSGERIIVSPEWQEISFTDSDFCIASKLIKGRKLFGCISYDGNISVPFVYSKISRTSVNGCILYIAEAFDGSSCVVYDSSFTPCFSRAWDSCTVDNDELLLTSGSGSYRYSAAGSGLFLVKALISGNTMKSDYSLEVTSRLLLSRLSVSALEEMSSAAGRYLEYAFTGSSEVLSDVKAAPSAVFLTLFPEEHSITSRRILGIPDIFVYSVRSDDGLRHFVVSATVDTALTYRNEEGRTKRMRDKYKALIEFSGSSANDLRVISAAFTDDRPDFHAAKAQQTSENQQEE